MRRTKIVATIGPASFAPRILGRLVTAGVNAFRLNFSHGTDAEHRRTLRRLHQQFDRRPEPVAILADLQGPKIRLGPMDNERYAVREGEPWVFEEGARPGTTGRASITFPDLRHAVRRGDAILIGDTGVEFEVRAVDGKEVRTVAAHGGTVTPHAGVYLPHARLRARLLGPKDRSDLALALAGGVDFVCLSFVARAEDIRTARRLLGRHRQDVGLIAKIERAAALEDLDGILAESDGIMVARGDLGVELPLERLALEQKRLVATANAAGKPVIVATQMLLSMVAAPRPTRAEATDVANAVLDGADAVMLSEESAVGQYPAEAVGWLDRIARATEAGLFDAEVPGPSFAPEANTPETAVAAAAVRLAREVGARAIVTPTHSGRTARLVAAHRGPAPVLALTARPSVRRRLALTWGTLSVASEPHLSLSDLRAAAASAVRRRLGGDGPVVLTAGFPVEGRPTNLVTVL